MTTLSNPLFDYRTLVAGDAMLPAEAMDLGPYTVLDLLVTVHEAGTGESPTLVLQHAPRNAEDAYVDFTSPIGIDLTAPGKTWLHIDAWTRYLGWSISGTLDSAAVVTVDVVARG